MCDFLLLICICFRFHFTILFLLKYAPIFVFLYLSRITSGSCFIYLTDQVLYLQFPESKLVVGKSYRKREANVLNLAISQTECGLIDLNLVSILLPPAINFAQ